VTRRRGSIPCPSAASGRIALQRTRFVDAGPGCQGHHRLGQRDATSNDHAALCQNVFHIAEAQAEPDASSPADTLPPRVVPAGGDFQHPAHRGDRIVRSVDAHELEDSGGYGPLLFGIVNSSRVSRKVSTKTSLCGVRDYVELASGASCVRGSGGRHSA